MAGGPDSVHGGRTLGRYILFDEIAKGGMATVHLGRLSGPVGFARTVAIKRLHPHMATDPEFVTMFVDEARLAAQIRHPNVVPTLDVVAVESEVFIVMEYVQGAPLSRLARALRQKNERMPMRFTLAAVAGALHGLHAAHEVTDDKGVSLGIVHRDVSPQNILIGGDGVARVLDFGVAKAAGRLQETGDSGSLKGKIAYMAPEQISGGVVNRRTDIYAASVVLWETLVGARLFDADNDVARAARVLRSPESEPIQPPSRFNPEVTPDVDALVMRGLAWPPESRWATAKEMAIAIEKSGGLVPASELGDWVEKLIGPELAKRAARLREIEGATRSQPELPTLAPLSSRVSVDPTSEAAIPVGQPSSGAIEIGSGVEPSAVSLPREAPPPALDERTGLRRALFALAIVLFGLVIGLAGWILGRERPRTVNAGAATSAAPSAVPGPTASGTMAEAPTPSSAPSTRPAPSVAVESSSRPVAPPRAPSPRVTAPRAKPDSKPDDCDPPYTLDAENHRIYKRHCMEKH